MRWLRTALLLELLAFWPVWRWSASRALQAPGELSAIPVVAAAGLLAARARTARGPAAQQSLGPVLPLLALYVLGLPFLPPLGRAALAFACVGATLFRWQAGTNPPPALWALFALALPVEPTLQFLLGYPARMASAALAVPLLRLGGLETSSEGAMLAWNGRLVAFDAACSGIRMLRGALLATLAVAAWRALPMSRVIVAVLGCGIAVVVANAWRAAALFHLEAVTNLDSPLLHEGIGLVVFVLLCAAVALATEGLHRWRR